MYAKVAVQCVAFVFRKDRAAPSGRSYHSSLLAGRTRLFILGGRDDQTNELLNDLHFFDVGRLTKDKPAYDSIRNLLWSYKKLVGNSKLSDVTL